MKILGIGVLVSKDQFVLSDKMAVEILEKVHEALNINLSKHESHKLSLQRRIQLLSVDEEDFQIITSAGHENIAKYLAKYILGIDESSKIKVKLKTEFLAWEKEFSPWKKDVFACVFFKD
jgi:hypothetical protein